MQPASLEVLEKAAVPPAQARAIVPAIEIEIEEARDTLATNQDILILRQEMTEPRTEPRRDMRDLRHGLELKIASTATQRQLYAALLGQMALLLRDRVLLSHPPGTLMAAALPPCSNLRGQVTP